MNYEEKYKEILEWARKNKARLNGVPIEEVLPELAESEDERIRKEMIGMINECTNWAHKKEYVKYLEKQKENPKTADSIPSDCVSDAKCEDRWYKVQDFTPADGRLVLAKDNIGNYLLASFAGGEWFVERYDLDDVPMRHTYVTEWCEIPSEKQYNESVAYHFPIMPTPPSGWGCDGTHCTNPHHDCINCPVKYSSGGTITTPNTSSGTSTLKAEG